MMANGHIIGDGSWDLRVYVTDLQIEHQVRVKGDLHIGGVMLKLVEGLVISIDWSDHALWWPEKNKWLTKTRLTLDQCGVQADALLHFTPMHKLLKVQIPDMRCFPLKVDFSIKTFSVVMEVCKELGIRHPEELSFCIPLEPNHLKYNYKDMPKKKISYNGGGGEMNGTSRHGPPPDTNTFIASSGPIGSNGSLDKSHLMCAPVTPQRSPASSTPLNSPMGTWKRNGADMSGNYSPTAYDSPLEQVNGTFYQTLANSPKDVADQAKQYAVRPRNLVEKARMNVAWLDSSLSIMEQGIREHDVLCLKFKFYVFYDLNPKHDAVRINQIYEQAKWQLLNEEIDCTEEEMLMFAALQLQIDQQALQPQPTAVENGNVTSQSCEDDIDAALTDLQTTLEGTNVSSQSNDITQVPELYDELRFLKPKRFTLKGFKRYWFTCRDLKLYMHRTREEMIHRGDPVQVINLKGCEVTPDVNISQNKYGIKLEVPSTEGMTEMYIRCDGEKQYAKWMACCKLAAKGRSLADSSYDTEVRTILDFLHMQKPVEGRAAINLRNVDINPEHYVSPRYMRKLKGKIVQRMVEAHVNIKDLSLIDAKMNYIKAWQSLPEYGVSLFVIRMMDHKKDQLLGVTHNRIMTMDINTGDLIKTWRYNTMKAWNVNWEVQHMMVQFEEANVIFSCLSADCKVVHEFIGGYIFLSMRSKEANQTLNEELFHKLTGGWS